MAKIKVIKALNKEHKKEILDYWESQGGKYAKFYSREDLEDIEQGFDMIGIEEHGYIYTYSCIYSFLELIELPETNKNMKQINTTINNEQQRDDLIKELKGLKFEKPLPKKWGDLEFVKGYFVNDYSNIMYTHGIIRKSNDHYNVHHTEKQALSALAKAKLSQVMAVYNGDWVADWNDVDQEKHTIERFRNNILCFTRPKSYQFLAFKTPELRDEFLKNFEEDIKIYFEL